MRIGFTCFKSVSRNVFIIMRFFNGFFSQCCSEFFLIIKVFPEKIKYTKNNGNYGKPTILWAM